MIDAASFLRTHTRVARPGLVPEVALHLAAQITPIWEASEAWLEQAGLAPPFWAFAWPGSQAVARWVLDQPDRVAGRRVLDFAAGSGLAAIACAMAGAAAVEAADIDPVALTAIAANAALNGVRVQAVAADVVGQSCRWDTVLCGDVCYEAPMTAHIMPWLRAMAAKADVFLADPARAYTPREGLQEVARFEVATTRELEDRDTRVVTLFRVTAPD